MMKLFVMFGTLIAFIYVISALEHNELRKDSHDVAGVRITDESVLQPVRKQLEAYNNRDISRFVESFSEDIILYDLQSGEVLCEGKDRMIGIYGDMFAQSPKLNCFLLNRIHCGDFVIDEEVVHGIRGNNKVHGTAIYEIKDSLIIKAWFIKGKVNI